MSDFKIGKDFLKYKKYSHKRKRLIYLNTL